MQLVSGPQSVLHTSTALCDQGRRIKKTGLDPRGKLTSALSLGDISVTSGHFAPRTCNSKLYSFEDLVTDPHSLFAFLLSDRETARV